MSAVKSVKRYSATPSDGTYPTHVLIDISSGNYTNVDKLSVRVYPFATTQNSSYINPTIHINLTTTTCDVIWGGQMSNYAGKVVQIEVTEYN